MEITMRRLSFFTLTAFILALTSSTCISGPAREMVFVSILPQKFFVQQISGSLLKVEVMVQPGANPATYEPKPSQMRKLAESKAYFAIGVPFENGWLAKISAVNPAMQVIHTDTGISKLPMASHHHSHEDSESHDESREEDHAETLHAGLDPHIWLSPVLAKIQVKTIFTTLINLFPQHAPAFETNYRTLLKNLDELHSELQLELDMLGGKRFMVFHPSWGYFAREYGLEQIPIEIEGKSPKPAQLQELIEYANSLGIRAIFAQSQFSTKSARIIAKELHGEVVVVDPLAEDYFSNLRKVAFQLKGTVK